jgi:hypothetical protein
VIVRFIRNRAGTAAAEFVLALPMMLALLFGAMEAGHFFWTQHKIVKSVRDGARFASRLSVDELCPAPANTTLVGEIQNVTATGNFDGGRPKVPGWNPADVVVVIECDEFIRISGRAARWCVCSPGRSPTRRSSAALASLTTPSTSRPSPAPQW